MRWININERKPNKDNYEVIIWSQSAFNNYDGNKDVFEPTVARWNNEHQKFSFVNKFDDTFPRFFDDLLEVTHWMPMVKPPSNEFESLKNNIDYLQGLIDGYGGEEPIDELPYGFKDINEVWDHQDKLKKGI